MVNRLTDSLNFQAQALMLRSERQRVIASNIANADTPNYQARDFNFAQALKQAVGETSPAVTLSATSAGHLSAIGSTVGVNPGLLYATPSQTNLDNNSVDLDRERANFADNTARYQATLRFISSEAKSILTAITGQ